MTPRMSCQKNTYILKITKNIKALLKSNIEKNEVHQSIVKINSHMDHSKTLFSFKLVNSKEGFRT